MPTHVALVRGINVGGRNRLPMADLRACFEDAGATGVGTYIQSGNVVFEAGARDAAQIVERVESILSESRGLGVPIVVRSSTDFLRAWEANPLLAEGRDPATLHLGFLLDEPSPEDVAAMDPPASGDDGFVVVGSHVYLHLPNGAAGTKLTTAFFDRALNTVLTVRNWRTIGRIAEMLG